MNDELRELKSSVDWWSRLIALGSLAISGAALYYAYRHEITLPVSTKSPANQAATDTKQIPTTPVAGSPLVPERSQLSEAVSAPSGADAATNDDATPIDWPAEKARTADPNDQLSRIEPNASGTNDASPQPKVGRGEDLAKPVEPPAEQPLGAPLLATVRTMLKPTSDLDYANATIRNIGNGEAQILELIFHPEDYEEIAKDASARSDWGLTDDKQLVVRFDSQDNRTTTPGRHGNYIRELQAPYRIQPNGTVDLKIVLENRDHLGYALVGKLTLRLEGADQFQIERVAIPFVE